MRIFKARLHGRTGPQSTSPAVYRWWIPVVISLALFGLNAYICRELFHSGFIRNLDSNEGAFVSISRFFREYGTAQGWFSWFDGGMPIENAYQPLFPMLAALAGKLGGWSVERAFHFVGALAFCCGPVALFWFAFDCSASLAAGFTAGLAWTLFSPAQLLIPVLRIGSDGQSGPLRLYNLVHYAEDPHILALTLIPLALLFLRRAIVMWKWTDIGAATVACALVMLSNAFGSVDLALGGICLVLALTRGFPILLLIGLASWLWISPWLPPSLIRHIGGDQWSAHGAFDAGLRSFAGAAMLVATSTALWFVTRRLMSPFERFAILFAVWMCALPTAYFVLNLTLVPQANRYQLELEMGVSLAIGCLGSRIFSRAGSRGRAILMVAILLAAARQTKIFRHFARGLIEPVDIAQTIQYKTTIWLDRNLPGQRAMVSGDTEFLYNVFSDNPQLSGGHQPTAPNGMQQAAVYAIYTGPDAEASILWLKAFGNQAITVPGEKSREHYHPFAHPLKFDRILPVLWHEEDDTIFAVPQRSRSLAHVIPKESGVTRRPLHGLDTNPLRAFVAALDDPNMPLASLTWRTLSHAVVEAPMRCGEVLSIQVNYAPGWRATVRGHDIPVHPDAIGLMVLDPGCDGPCEVDLRFGPSAEAWCCRVLSGLASVALVAWIAFAGRLKPLAKLGIFARARTEPHRPPSPHSTNA